MDFRQFTFPECTCGTASDFVGEQRLSDFSRPDLPVIGKTVYRLRFIGEHRHSARRRKVTDQFDHEIRTSADDVLGFVNNQVLHAIQVIGDALIELNELDYSSNVLFVRA